MAAKRELPFSATLTFTKSNKPGKTISLSLRADEAKLGWQFPTIRYAIRRLYIHFNTFDCILPEEDWSNDSISISETDLKYSISNSNENEDSVEASWSATSPIKVLGSRRKEAVQGTDFSMNHLPLLAHGSGNAPTWSLTSSHPAFPLLGTLIKNSHFCRVQPIGPHPKISLSFEIPYDALLFKKSGGFYVSGNKYGILRLLIRKHLCEKRYKVLEEDVE